MLKDELELSIEKARARKDDGLYEALVYINEEIKSLKPISDGKVILVLLKHIRLGRQVLQEVHIPNVRRIIEYLSSFIDTEFLRGDELLSVMVSIRDNEDIKTPPKLVKELAAQYPGKYDSSEVLSLLPVLFH